MWEKVISIMIKAICLWKNKGGKIVDWITKCKAAVSLLLGTLSAWLGVLAVPVYVLVLCNVIDYATGIAAAWKRGEKVNSHTGIRGITKKVCMWLLVAVGGILDWLLLYTGESLGLEIHLPMLAASLTAVWLICNEVLSILENMKDIGVPLPGFLGKLVSMVQGKLPDSQP